MKPRARRLRWRDYRTAAGGRPVKAFLDRLTDEQAAAVVAAMKDVAQNGLAAARHLRGEVYEVRAEAERQAFRVLFAQETTFILLSLSGFQKKSAKTPRDEIGLAETRLADWRRRGRPRKP
jgi:phage-related protein